MTPTLRAVDPGDAPLVRALVAARRPELAGLPEAVLDMQVEAQRRDYAARFPSAREEIVVLDGRAVGRWWVDRGGEPWHLLDIVLLPEARGAGLGTALLRDLLAEADRAGATVRLTVEVALPRVRALYARLGFAGAGVDGAHEVMERRPRARAAPRATG